MRAARRFVAPSVLVAASIVAAPAHASPADVAHMVEVEAALVRVAREASPKTICVRVKMAGGGEGFGSGAVVSADGLVLTCAHVTEPGKGGSLRAILAGGDEVALSVVASNARNDYALCRMATERKDLPFFSIAPADPTVGDWVVALGHPGGPYEDKRPTVAAGKVVGTDRSLPILLQGKAYVGALQTDAPIFGGNSGGPLVDLAGRLVGINGAILLVGDAAFAASAARIAKDLPALREGHDVDGEEIADLVGTMQALTSEFDPEELAEAFANEQLRDVFRMLASAQGDTRDANASPRARRRLDDLRDAWPEAGIASAHVLVDGTRIALATPLGMEEGRAFFLTTARVAQATGTITVSYAPRGPVRQGNHFPYAQGAARIRGVDGRYDVALLDVESLNDVPIPRFVGPEDVVPGSFVLVPDGSARPFQGGIVAAIDRTVGTERRVPTLGIVRLFQPPHVSAFRPYPRMVQIDTPLEADELGAPVVRPDGSLVGVAVAHFNRGATLVVPAAELKAIVERLLKGIDSPAPETYGPPPRPAPDRAARAARRTERSARVESLTLYVPTLAGVLRPVRFDDREGGPVAPEDSGGGPLDVRAGDVLVSIAGTASYDVASGRAAIATLAKSSGAVVVLRRGGADVRYDATVEGEGHTRKIALRALAK